MKSFLEVEGLYDPSKRFAFTNITDKDFTSAWGGSPITVKPGQTIELAHYLAIKLTGELVDKIMIGEAKLDEVEQNKPYYRSPKGTSLGVPAARKVFEDQILRELAPDEESPQLQVERARIRAELQADMLKSQEAPAPVSSIPVNPAEFSEVGKSEPTPVKKPLKVKTL